MCQINLEPQVRVIELLGGTGNGKTQVATVPAADAAKRILRKGAGSTNSTLNEHLFVYTNDKELSGSMLVAVKYDEDAFSRDQFIDIVSKSIAQVVKITGKYKDPDDEMCEDLLIDKLKSQLQRKNNVKAILSLLDEEIIDDFINDVCCFYSESTFYKESYDILNTVKSIKELEGKASSQQFLSAIQQEVQQRLDEQPQEVKDKLWSIRDKIKNGLSSVFFKSFDDKNISLDGYYFKKIDLEDPDNDFINAMFTSNDLQAGQKLSLEVLCSKIVIYVPMSDKIAQIIRQDYLTRSVFSNSTGDILFGIRDTRGLYHADNTDDQNEDYCSELMSKTDIDAISIVFPMDGDTNEKKLKELYKSVLNKFNKQIPIFMVNNKLDLFVDKLRKQDADYDDDEYKLLSQEELIEQIEGRVADLKDNLATQSEAGVSLQIQAFPCYLKQSEDFAKIFSNDRLETYDVFNVYKNILQGTAASLKDCADKIKFNPLEGEVPKPIVDEKLLVELVHAHVTDPVTVKDIFNPGFDNLKGNLNKTPHGNSYHALHRRVRNGEGGFISTIKADHYINCQSFAVTFPDNLHNFLSKEFVHAVVGQVVNIEGVRYDQEALQKFRRIVEKLINANQRILVIATLYNKAMLDAEKNAISFRWKFKGFLDNSKAYLDAENLDEDLYVEAIKSIILSAAKREIALNVAFR